MFALRMELLTGRYCATAYSERGAAEWPPHPARVFSALAATLHADDSPDPAEREALLWLEQQRPPAVCASEASRRSVVTHFVPVNDTAVHGSLDKVAEGVASATSPKEVDKAQKKFAAAMSKETAAPAKVSDAAIGEARRLLPEGRKRQARTFPSVTPEVPTVSLVWADVAPEPAMRDALDRLAARVVRVGHSSSLISLAVVDEAPASDFEPADDGADVFRVPASGQLDRLEEAFSHHRETEPRVMPASFQRYRRAVSQSPQLPCTPWDPDWIVFRRIMGPRVPIERGLDVAAIVRRALIRFATEPVPTLISGHNPDGSAAQTPHLAVVPLADIGHAHADGAIRGFAIVLPSGLTDTERQPLYAAIRRWEGDRTDGRTVPVHLGSAGVLTVERVLEPGIVKALWPSTWRDASCNWSTATPVALDRNPGNLRSRQPETASVAEHRAAESIGQACVSQGLPRPAVTVTFQPLIVAVPSAAAFGPYPRARDRQRRVCVHAHLTFDRPVQGPILLGAGRFLGHGLFRPVNGVAS